MNPMKEIPNPRLHSLRMPGSIFSECHQTVLLPLRESQMRYGRFQRIHLPVIGGLQNKIF
jgi:hypothetical protein